MHCNGQRGDDLIEEDTRRPNFNYELAFLLCHYVFYYAVVFSFLHNALKPKIGPRANIV